VSPYQRKQRNQHQKADDEGPRWPLQRHQWRAVPNGHDDLLLFKDSACRKTPALQDGLVSFVAPDDLVRGSGWKRVSGLDGLPSHDRRFDELPFRHAGRGLLGGGLP
jgi:hypothetical protein